MPEDRTITSCPFCDSTKFYWRVKQIESHPVHNPGAGSISAIEIYCASCHKTISLTPMGKR